MDAADGPLGAPLPRKEDPRLLRGEARFLDDLDTPRGTLHVTFVRSPHAHARLLGVDAAAALALPGVHAVLTAEGLPELAPLVPDRPLPGFQVTERPLLCRDRVRHVGDTVAMVLADDPYVAEDAAELVLADYDPLPACVTLEHALEGGPAVHDAAPDNLLFRNTVTTEGFDAAFAAAPHMFREVFRSHRVATVSLEPRGCLAVPDPGLDEVTLFSSTQVPHLLRNTLAEALALPESRLRVVAPDVGGGFGVKASVYPEEILCAAAARRLRRPVKWVGDRQDDFLTSSHARDMRFGVEMATDAEGRIQAIRLDVTANAGAYAGIPFGSSLEAGGGPRTFPGPYRFRHYSFTTRAVATHTTPSGPYRGVAAPIAFLAFEGMLDRAARALGLDPAEIRRRNLLAESDFPWVNASGIRHDNGALLGPLERALELSGYGAFRAAQARGEASDARVLRGIGLATITEQTGQGSSRYRARGLLRIPGIEGARLKVEPDGQAVLAVSQTTQGQGHLTTFAQMAAHELGLPVGRITVQEGDTALSPYGSGTFASRAVVAGGGAVMLAARVIADKIRRIAGDLLEADPKDIVLRDGVAQVAGVPGLSVTLEEVARTAHAMRPRGLPEGESFGLDTTQHWDQPFSSVSAAVHVAQVAVDRATGQVTVERYSIVHDCGVMVNPLVVDGQTHGAVAQGLGPALMERLLLDPGTGQVLTTTLLDYPLPTALDVPDMAMDHQTTPALDTTLGVKGMAEGGTIGAIPALVNALADALRPTGFVPRAIPVRPDEILRAIRKEGP